MQAAVLHARYDVRFDERPIPILEQPIDAIDPHVCHMRVRVGAVSRPRRQSNPRPYYQCWQVSGNTGGRVLSGVTHGEGTSLVLSFERCAYDAGCI